MIWIALVSSLLAFILLWNFIVDNWTAGLSLLNAEVQVAESHKPTFKINLPLAELELP